MLHPRDTMMKAGGQQQHRRKIQAETSLLLLLFLLSCSRICVAFNSSSMRRSQSHRQKLKGIQHDSRFMTPINSQSILESPDQVLAAWTFAFASSHIGLSSTRSNIIRSLGETANSLNLVGNEEWVLPSWWPGDNTGGNKIFPDVLTAGRQVYRVFYTAVSFLTLGSAFGAYFESSSVALDVSGAQQSTLLYNSCILSAALSFGAAIASLVNASPLGLMPSFEADDGTEMSCSVAGIRRDDTLKFAAKGLTRITRHPLILPVVPWGIATTILVGGRPCDAIFFGGLSIYSIAGCYFQDLRVIREEGSVGTVFQTESGGTKEGLGEDEQERTRLRSFFEQTSFIPFKAVFDGRQSFDDIIREAPWLQFFVGTIVGVYLEEKILQLLAERSV